jgi:hypothetical protein
MTVLMEVLDGEVEDRPADMPGSKVKSTEDVFFFGPRGERARIRNKFRQ